jgi:4'-phosphopantetheinyl transferase
VSNEIEIWPLDLDDPALNAGALEQLLSPDERERAGRLRAPNLARRFIVCRAALRQVLGRSLDCDPPGVAIRYSATGKPELADPPHRGLHFNVTHSQQVAIIAVSRDRPIGVDVERIRPDFATEEIAGRFFSAAERAALARLAAVEQPLAFFRCWTRKEAFIKATGAGLSFPLDEFDVSLAPDEPPRLLAIQGDSTAAAEWAMRELPAPPNFVAAVACPGPIGRIIMRGAAS